MKDITKKMKDITKKIEAIINKVGKFISTFKTIGLIVLMVLFGISLINNGCDRQEANDLLERVTGLNVQNDILKKDIKQRQKEIAFRDSIINHYKDSLAVVVKAKEGLDYDYGVLEGEYRDIASKLIKTPTDSSYVFLDRVAYPYSGEKKFPFNEPQIKSIHITYLERFMLVEKEKNLLAQVNNYESQLSLKDTIYNQKEMQYKKLNMNARSYEEIIDNKDEEIVLKDVVIKKNNRRNKWLKLTIVIVAALIAPHTHMKWTLCSCNCNWLTCVNTQRISISSQIHKVTIRSSTGTKIHRIQVKFIGMSF